MNLLQTNENDEEFQFLTVVKLNNKVFLGASSNWRSKGLQCLHLPSRSIYFVPTLLYYHPITFSTTAELQH
jgi:hypothetical protein